MTVGELLDRFPDGWSVATYAGRRYSVVKTSHVGGRATSLLAEELGGSDLVSANLYRARDAEELRPCEMPAEKVLSFLRDASPGDDEAPGPASRGLDHS